MGRSVRKLNFIIEESVCLELQSLVPAGKRSKVVNEALRKELEKIRRKKAVDKLLTSNPSGKVFASQEIVERLAQDRRVH